MGKGNGALFIDTHADDMASASAKASAKKEKKEKKEKKDKKDKKDRKDKKEKKSKKRSAEQIQSEPPTPVQSFDVPPQKKIKTDYPASTNSRHPSEALAVEDDAEDTDIGLGQSVSRDIKTNKVTSFGMSDTTVRLLKEKGIENLFDIQAATFKMLRTEKKDVIGRARTGSGKTLAFVLPIIETMQADAMHKVDVRQKPLVLCLAPTRELAQQVHRDFDWIASGHRISTACFTGGAAKGPQFGALRRGLDVLVGTPGRIIDHLDEGTLSLAGVRFVVLDEADEMLSMGFQDAVERILGSCTSTEFKQTLLFSATVPRWVKDLAKKYMRSNATVTVDTVSDDKNRTNSDITHLAIGCPWSERGSVIADVVKVYTGALGKTIIFTDTKAEANEVSNQEKLINALGGAGVLHGDIPQNQREATLAAYREGKIRVLVATDVAARGLDIKAVDLVLQTHPPSNYETYIHRSGRTGRAGMTGTCVTFFSPKEKYMIGLIEHKAGIKLKRTTPPQPEHIVRASVSDTVKTLASVHEDNLAMFREVARQVVESYKGEKGAAEKALAASLATMAGYTHERFKTRSMLSCFQEAFAVVFTAPQKFESSGHAWSQLRRYIGSDLASQMKRMQLCKDKTKSVFDAPHEHWNTILEVGERMGNGYSLEIASGELPELEEEPFDLKSAMMNANERRNSFRNRRSSGGGGGFRSRGGGGGGFRGGRNGFR